MILITTAKRRQKRESNFYQAGIMMGWKRCIEYMEAAERGVILCGINLPILEREINEILKEKGG